MKIFYTKEFAGMLTRLPQDIRCLFDTQEAILKENWRDPRMHLKKLGGKPVMFSFRITRAYRAFLYLRAAEEVTLFAVGHRKDIYRKLRRR